MKKDGGPAFPTDSIPYERGMSMRAYLAGLAMQGIVTGAISATKGIKSEEEIKAICRTSIEIADALIAELEHE